MIYSPSYCSCSWSGAALSHNALASGTHRRSPIW